MKSFNKLTNYCSSTRNLNKVVKNLLTCLTFMAFFGCGNLPVNNTSNSTANTCPEQPKGSLDTKNVKPISLSTQIVKASGQASSNTSVAYTFEAKAGQRLSYRTKDTICVWIYTPDNQLLNSGDLPKDGNYILQVSAPQGSTTFELEMTLGTLQASPSPLPVATSTPASTPNFTPASTPAVADLTQDRALQIVQNWYSAKPRIYAPPFDTSLVEQYATGNLYYNTTKSDPTSGRIAWLRAHDSYYTYKESRINNVLNFSNSGSRPSITVNVYEDLYLNTPKGIDRTNSGPYQANFIYYFEKDNGVWKIYDYQKAR